MQRRPVVIVLLFTAVALAGCSGGGDEAPTDAQAPPDGEVPPLGTVTGTVFDDLGRPLPGARASILGESIFQDTGPDGDFTLADVPVGAQDLLVSASGFQSHREAITVDAGAAANVTVHLLPKQDVGPGSRPHAHDLWRGQDEATLLDADFDLSEPARPGNHATAVHKALSVSQTAVRGGDWGPIPLDPDQRSIVYPGTARLELVLTWDMEGSTASELGLDYRAADGTSEELDARASDEPFSIDVTPEMADTGHQMFTLWDFYIEIPQASGPSLGDVHVTITIFKGSEPPLEPAHEDFWANGTALLLRDGEQVTTYPSDNMNRYQSAQLGLDSERIVPPGTGTLEVRFWYMLDHPTTAVTHPDGYYLTWRSADRYHATTPVGDYASAEPVESGEEGGWTWMHYTIDLEKEQTDGFYQTRTNWAFVPAHPGNEDDSGDFGWPSARKFRMEVTAVQDPAYDR